MVARWLFGHVRKNLKKLRDSPTPASSCKCYIPVAFTGRNGVNGVLSRDAGGGQSDGGSKPSRRL